MKLITTITAAGAAAALALPAVAVAADSPQTPSAQQQCRTERTAMGQTVFAQTYGTNANRSNAFGKCVSKRASATSGARQGAAQNAAKTCKAAQGADATAFAAKWGKGKNAYGKCVSATTRADAAAKVAKQVRAEVNAARSCRTEQKAGATAFARKYGKPAGARNAFGKCVSTTAAAKSRS